jgi:uncharacterized protein YjbK
MDEDIYYVDTRNADLRDHRVGVGIRPGSIVPARTVTLTLSPPPRMGTISTGITGDHGTTWREVAPGG